MCWGYMIVKAHHINDRFSNKGKNNNKPTFLEKQWKTSILTDYRIRFGLKNNHQTKSGKY